MCSQAIGFLFGSAAAAHSCIFSSAFLSVPVNKSTGRAVNCLVQMCVKRRGKRKKRKKLGKKD